VGHCQHGSIFVAIDVIAPAKRDHSAFRRPVRGLDFGAGQNIRAVSCRVTPSSTGTKKPTIDNIRDRAGHLSLAVAKSLPSRFPIEINPPRSAAMHRIDG
jgi:hypothetical protein